MASSIARFLFLSSTCWKGCPRLSSAGRAASRKLLLARTPALGLDQGRMGLGPRKQKLYAKILKNAMFCQTPVASRSDSRGSQSQANRWPQSERKTAGPRAIRAARAEWAMDGLVRRRRNPDGPRSREAPRSALVRSTADGVWQESRRDSAALSAILKPSGRPQPSAFRQLLVPLMPIDIDRADYEDQENRQRWPLEPDVAVPGE